MLTVTVSGFNETIASFDVMPQKLHDALLIKMVELEQKVIAKVQQNLSGDVLQSRTGALRSSISGLVTESADGITATIGSYGVPYAAIQEFGGTTSPHDIFPNKARVLAFIMDGKQVFARFVHHPGSKIPAHYYLNGALEDMRLDIIRGIGEAAVEAAIL